MAEVGLVESVERVLCLLYKDQAAIERLLDHARLDLNQFEFSGNHQSMVNKCLRKAQGLGKLPDVIEAALRDNEEHVDLKGLLDEFNLKIPIEDQILSLVKALGGFRVPLRQSRHLTRDELNEFDAILQKIFDKTEWAESKPNGGDANSGRWDELNRALPACLGQFQFYREVLNASVRSAHRRVPGALYTRIPLADVASDKMTLIGAKLDLLEALDEVLRACGRSD
jgi:hypothetical protein